uniref:Uncharacterized protein n=1 Tax=Knipowitschia caucasica TaxID=637954 RepID=A0AAV2JG82_KNICA
MENIGHFETGEGPEQGHNAPSDTVSLDQLVSNLFSQLQDFEEDLFHWGHPPELQQLPQHEATHSGGDIQLETVDQEDVSAQIQAEDLHAEGEAACRSLDQPISELEVLRERHEAVQHQLKEFDNVKEENSCLVQINQRLELKLQQLTEKSQQSQSEQTEAYRRLRDLQLSQEKDLQQKCEDLQRLQQRQEEQETLQQKLEQEKLQQRLEEQERLQQRLEEQEKLQQRLEEQERLCQSLERQISERESERTNIDLLEQKLEEFEGLKQDYCGLVTYCQSLQTDLEQTKEKLLHSEFVRQDLLLSHQKALKEHREQLQRVKQHMEEQKEAHSCLEQQDSEREIQNRKIEALTRELEDFEDVKGEYSRLVSHCKRLEKDLEEAKRCINPCINKLSQEQLLEKESLQQKAINKSSEREMIERLKRELEDFEDVKGEYSRLVSLCKRLEKDLEDANRCINQQLPTDQLLEESLKQVAVDKSSEREMRERIERLKSELEDFEDVKREYSQLVSLCKRLEKDLEEAKKNSLVVVAEQVSETCVDTRESVSEEKMQSQPSDQHQQSCVRKTINVFGQQSSRERPTPKNSQHECEELRGLNGSVKNLTQFFGPEHKTKEEKQGQGSDLNRTSAKRGERVAALMKMFES